MQLLSFKAHEFVYTLQLNVFVQKKISCCSRLKFQANLQIHVTVEPRYNEGPRDWQNMFAISRFRYIEVLFHIFCYYWDEKYRSLYRRRTSLYRGSLNGDYTVLSLFIF